jgi:nucleoside-diphosphate-sugar epimerase
MDVFDGLNNKKIAVTGANGYIGAALVNALTKYSSQILCISRRELKPMKNTLSLKADIRTNDCWPEIVERADIIFHLAGNTSVYAAANDPSESLASTLFPITHLIRAAQEVGCKPRVIYASTATVYGLTEKTIPVNETFEPKPITVYDLHKYFAEKQLALATQLGLIEGVSLRLANVYGSSASVSSAEDRGILNKVTSMAMQGKDISLYGGGNYLRDYVFIDDVVSAFMLAGLSDEVGDGVFNVATGNSVSVREAFNLVALMVENNTGHKVQLKTVPWPEGANPIDFRNYVANIKSISATLGWHPLISLEAGIGRMIERLGDIKDD